jgi:polysaccharide biosynthesis protein
MGSSSCISEYKTLAYSVCHAWSPIKRIRGEGRENRHEWTRHTGCAARPFAWKRGQPPTTGFLRVVRASCPRTFPPPAWPGTTTIVTVTHPEVTRYVMTIPEAVQLILEAAGGSRRRDLHPGDGPVRIADLARQVIRLSGFEPDEDVEIGLTGLSPGEKLHEELVSDGADVVPTHHDRSRVLRPPDRPSHPDGWPPTLEACVTGLDAALEVFGNTSALVVPEQAVLRAPSHAPRRTPRARRPSARPRSAPA